MKIKMFEIFLLKLCWQQKFWKITDCFFLTSYIKWKIVITFLKCSVFPSIGFFFSNFNRLSRHLWSSLYVSEKVWSVKAIDGETF